MAKDNLKRKGQEEKKKPSLTRAQFYRDLKKVARKVPTKDQPK
jgi:hypothetical protein